MVVPLIQINYMVQYNGNLVCSIANTCVSMEYWVTGIFLIHRKVFIVVQVNKNSICTNSKVFLYRSLQYDVITSVMASQITSLTIVYSTVYSGADQRKHQSFASLAFVRGIHRWPVNSPHRGPVTRKMFPYDDVIMAKGIISRASRKTAVTPAVTAHN